MRLTSAQFDLSFQAQLELLHVFLARRADIVERIQGLLNAQRKPLEYLRDGLQLSDDVEDCFFTLPGITHDQLRLRGQLEEAHWAGGFKPRDLPGLHNGLADPGEMMVRAFHVWTQTRWPGRNGRVRYAHTLFNLYLIRGLALLSMRMWDDGASGASDRLSRVQHVLDRLWSTTPADQPALVRDARWLIPMAQSPATEDLGVYFDVAERIADTLSTDDRLAIHDAGVRLAAGHLRSQSRYHSTKNAVPLADERLLVSTRGSNALDYALLVDDLVPLLEAYEDACRSGDESRRPALADAICQGVSADPDLFLNRIDLLSAYSMIEHLFVATDPDGRAVYTPMGQRHVRLIQEYEALMSRVAQPLLEDCSRFRPVAGTYSPFGVLYGFASDLIEHMVLKTLQPDAASRFCLEDAFAAGDAAALAWVSGWRKLPHIAPDVAKLFDYPQQFAEDVFDRVEQALRRRVSDAEPPVAAQTGRLFVASSDAAAADSNASQIPELPARYVSSSDAQLVAAGKASFCDEPRLLADRREGKYVLSYGTPRGWVAITKAVFTEVLGAGRDVTIVGLPPVAAGLLRLMYPALVSLPDARQ